MRKIDDSDDRNDSDKSQDIDIDGIDIICNFNTQGIKDLCDKMLISSDCKILTHGSSKFYFWRLVKTCEEFIDKIENNNNKHKSNIW